MQNNLVMTSSPHLRDHSSTQRIMQEVCLALLPAGIAGVIIFGWSALMLICVSVATCVLSEFVWEKLTKRTVTIGDWSAVVTGLLLAYNLPANAPWWLAVVGGVIAIILVKQMFGGIGSNFMNPALTARAILFVSWSALMSSYPQSNFVVDATTSATPLGLLSKGVSGVNFMDLLLGNWRRCAGRNLASWRFSSAVCGSFTGWPAGRIFTLSNGSDWLRVRLFSWRVSCWRFLRSRWRCCRERFPSSCGCCRFLFCSYH